MNGPEIKFDLFGIDTHYFIGYTQNYSSTLKEVFMEKLSFYDVKSKKKFESDAYKVQEKGGRFFAVVKSPVGTHECWRVLSKDQAKKLKG